MVRESGISATKPTFPSYLLPSLKFPFPRSRRRSSATSANSGSSDDLTPSTGATTPSNSPPSHEPVVKPAADAKSYPRLRRAAPDALRCSRCSADLAFATQIISKGFTGRYGRAFLVAPPASSAQQSLLNIRVGRNENRQLVTGWHVVADITCGTCASKLGWKYVDAKEQSQQYKVGKFILETERVMTYRSWEDVGVPEFHEAEVQDGEGDASGEDGEEVAFDSEDEDECEDIFAGTWDAETVARRRSRMVARRKDAVE